MANELVTHALELAQKAIDAAAAAKNGRLVDRLQHIKTRAASGYIDGLFHLGCCLNRGGCGVEQNYVAAAACFRLGADAGDLDSSRELGWLCTWGHGVEKDAAEGARLLGLLNSLRLLIYDKSARVAV